MIVKNNKPKKIYLFYKASGVVNKVPIPAYGETPDLSDLTDVTQIIFNGHEQALRNVEAKFGKQFDNAYGLPTDPASEFTYYNISATTITATGGTMSPSGATVQVAKGENKLFNLYSELNYYLTGVTVDDGNNQVSAITGVATGTSYYTLVDVLTDHALSVAYSPYYNFIAYVESVTGGTISPSGATIQVGQSQTQLFSAISETNYYLTGLTVDGGNNQVSAITGSASGTSTYTTATGATASQTLIFGYGVYGS